MKKLIMLTIIGSSLYAGNFWDIVKNITLTKVNAKGYEISVQGVNIRGYSYHPLMPNGEPNKKVLCNLVFTEENMQMSCIELNK